MECEIGKYIKDLLKNKIIITDNKVSDKRKFYFYKSKDLIWKELEGETNLENIVRKLFQLITNDFKNVKKSYEDKDFDKDKMFQFYKQNKRDLNDISTGMNIKNIIKYCNRFWFNPKILIKSQ